MPRRQLKPKRVSLLKHQAGAAMMEIVVSLFTLAVGLMGTLAMQIKGVSCNQQATLVTQANILAADMADRILAYDSSDISSDNDDYNGIYTGSAGSAPSTADCAAGCVADEQLALDKYQWAQQISTRLPGGTGEVKYDSANGLYTIVLKWNQSDAFVDSSCAGIVGDLQDTATDKVCFAYQFVL